MGLLETFYVRRADSEFKDGYDPSIIGVVQGDEWYPGANKKPIKVFHVLWYNCDADGLPTTGVSIEPMKLNELIPDILNELEPEDSDEISDDENEELDDHVADINA